MEAGITVVVPVVHPSDIAEEKHLHNPGVARPRRQVERSLAVLEERNRVLKQGRGWGGVRCMYSLKMDLSNDGHLSTTDIYLQRTASSSSYNTLRTSEKGYLLEGQQCPQGTGAPYLEVSPYKKGGVAAR